MNTKPAALPLVIHGIPVTNDAIGKFGDDGLKVNVDNLLMYLTSHELRWIRDLIDQKLEARA